MSITENQDQENKQENVTVTENAPKTENIPVTRDAPEMEKNAKLYICNLCHKEYKDESGLRKHKKKLNCTTSIEAKYKEMCNENMLLKQAIESEKLARIKGENELIKSENELKNANKKMSILTRMLSKEITEFAQTKTNMTFENNKLKQTLNKTLKNHINY